MKLTEEEVEQIFQNEINWCQGNPDEELSSDFQRGFIKGLEQAKLLIEQAEKTRWNVEYRFILGRPPFVNPYTTTGT